MSLINRVLSELERRDASDTGPRPLPSGVRPIDEARRRGRRGWLVLILSLVAVVTGGLWWWLPQRQPAAPAQPPIASAPGQEPAAVLPASPTVQPPASAPAQPAATAPAVEPVREAAPAKFPPATTDRPELQPKRKSAADVAELPAAGTTASDAPNTMETATESTLEARAAAAFRRGVTLYQKGQADEAESNWHSALELDPANDSARRALASLWSARGDRDAAEALLAEGLKAHPDRLRLAMALARLQLDRRAMTDSLRTMEAGLPYAQESGEYLAMTAELKARAGQFGQAADLYQSALRAAPGNGTWLIGQGLALRAEGRTDEAFDVFQQARDMRSLDPQQRALVERQLRELGG